MDELIAGLFVFGAVFFGFTAVFYDQVAWCNDEADQKWKKQTDH